MNAASGPAATGHGHVIPRPDGVKARCGGPALCGVCAKELAAVAAKPPVTAVTPGQAAYEERRRLTAERIGEALEDFGVPWAAQSDANRSIEEAAAQAAIAAQQPAPDRSLLALVDAHFVGNGPYPLQLVCWTEDASDVECDTEITEVEPGVTWDELEARIVAHAAQCHAAARAQTSLTLPDTTPQGAPMVRLTPCPAEGHDGAHIQWNSSGHWLCGQQVADALGAQGIFADRPEAEQPAPELQAGEIVYLYHWRFDRGEEFGLYRHAADADAMAAKHAGEGLSEVLSMAILGRPEQPAPGLAAHPPSPEPDGTIVIGPQCFASADSRVISWRGINYYPWASDPDHQVLPAPGLAAPGLAAAMAALAEYERYAGRGTVPSTAVRLAIRERAGLEGK